MRIERFLLGPLEVNTYLVYDEQTRLAAVVDPGDAPQIAQFLTAHDLTLTAILLTHGHFDHVGGVKKLVEQTNCRVWLHPLEKEMPPRLTAGTLYSTDDLAEGTEISVGTLRFHTLHTPGHSAGSVCFVCEDVLFSGDTLFDGGCGRTDLFGGSRCAIKESLRRLYDLAGDLRVLPGHGTESTLDLQRQYNPTMGKALHR